MWRRVKGLRKIQLNNLEDALVRGGMSEVTLFVVLNSKELLFLYLWYLGMNKCFLPPLRFQLPVCDADFVSR